MALKFMNLPRPHNELFQIEENDTKHLSGQLFDDDYSFSNQFILPIYFFKPKKYKDALTETIKFPVKEKSIGKCFYPGNRSHKLCIKNANRNQQLSRGVLPGTVCYNLAMTHKAIAKHDFLYLQLKPNL